MNLDVPENISYKLVTELVFHEEMSWLKVSALWNIAHMLRTELVSHEERFPLKAFAPENITAMLVTELVSQEERSWLKLPASENMPLHAGDRAGIPIVDWFVECVHGLEQSTKVCDITNTPVVDGPPICSFQK